MTRYVGEYSFKEQGWGVTEIDSDDMDQAELDIMNYVRDSNPEAFDVEVTSIKEI